MGGQPYSNPPAEEKIEEQPAKPAVDTTTPIKEEVAEEVKE